MKTAFAFLALAAGNAAAQEVIGIPRNALISTLADGSAKRVDLPKGHFYYNTESLAQVQEEAWASCECTCTNEGPNDDGTLGFCIASTTDEGCACTGQNGCKGCDIKHLHVVSGEQETKEGLLEWAAPSHGVSFASELEKTVIREAHPALLQVPELKAQLEQFAAANPVAEKTAVNAFGRLAYLTPEGF